MATYRQDDDHDRITHVDMLNLLRQDMREGFAQQREAFNGRFDALDSKVDTNFDALDSKVETKFDGVDTRFDALDSKIDAKFDGLGSRFDALGNKFAGLGSRFDALGNKLDALGCKVDGLGHKLDVSIAEHAKEADERRKERPLLIGIAIGVAITAVVSVSEFVVQYLPAIIRALQSGP